MGRRFERTVRRGAIAVATILLLTACGSEPGTDGSASEDPIFTSPTGELPAEPVIDGLFSIGDDGRLALRCWGEGSPVIVLEVGTDPLGGISQFSSTLAPPLADAAMTCTYDRLGAGVSDPAPRHERTLDDLVTALHRLLGAADVPPPYVMVGSSGGGAISIHYAGAYRDEVEGLVLLDVSAPEPELAKEFPDEAGWDNEESVDWYAMGAQLAYHRLPIADIPVRIVTAASGRSSAKDQSFWLQLSPLAIQRTVEGGHVIYRDNIDACVAQIRSVLRAIEANG
jgi:pimeloyl-ACP methyl ester carboxylesterase